MELIGQIVGVIGFVFSVGAFLQKKDINVKYMLSISCAFVSVSYYLTEAYAGAFIILISCIRNFVATRNNIAHLFPVFLTANILAAIYGYREWYDVIALCGVLCSTTSIFKLKDLNFRYGMIASCSFWLIYNIITFSIGPMMMETFNIAALCLAVYRIKKGERPVHEVRSE
jgi:hypothetical protein